jgi:hypothetical protein
MDLKLAGLPEERTNGMHDLNSRGTLDRRRVRELVMSLTSSQTNHRPPEQPSNAFDDVAVGHRNAKDWRARL